MKRRIVAFIAMLLAISVMLPACATDGDTVDTTLEATDPTTDISTEDVTDTEQADTGDDSTETDEPVDSTDKDTEKAEFETDTKAPETTETNTTAVTTPGTTGTQGGTGGGAIEIGPIVGGGEGGEKDPTIPEGYFMTASGKILAHTYSDRSTNGKDDNSTTLPFMPMKSTTNLPDPQADYNRPKADLATLRPGALTQGVLVGYDDYMFYKDTLYDFQGQGVLADTIYQRTVATLKERNDWAEKNGKKFFFVIAPNKNSVYSDYMPEGYKLATYRRYDQFVEILEDAGITAVDLRGPMIAAVKANPKENLYYKYDTHWNNHGGYVAYRATMDLIDEAFPSVVIHDRSEYQINYAETYMKDMAWYLGCYDKVKDYGPVYTLKSGKTAKLSFYQEKQGWGQFQFAHIAADGYSDKLYYYQYTNEYNKSAPNIYIMRDSYSIAMVPFLKDSFYKSTYNWTFEFSKSAIQKADADIIMVIVAERNLRNYVNNQAVND